MRVRPGPNLIRCAMGLALISLLVFAIPSVAWGLLLAVIPLTAFAVLDARDVSRQLKAARLTRELPSLAGRGRPFAVRWRLERDGEGRLFGEWRDCPPRVCEPHFHVVPLDLAADVGEVDSEKTFQIPVRGEYSFGPLWLRLTGRFGLIEGQRPYGDPETIRILPETYHSPDELHKGRGAEELILDQRARSRQHGVGTEFESLNEFREGDDPRRIDWRTTARMRKAIVRQYQIERHRDVMLVVDCGRLMGGDGGAGTKLDCAIDAALMVARVALQGGDRCGVALFDDQILGYLPPVSGVASLRTIAECIYDAQTRWRESDFARMFAALQQKQSRRALVVVISDMVDQETTQRFRASLASLSKRHVILFAALQTPLLDGIVHADITGTLDPARKAVAFQLLRERERALHAVRRGGVDVLDVTPAQLTIPLVNEFVALRQRSLI